MIPETLMYTEMERDSVYFKTPTRHSTGGLENRPTLQAWTALLQLRSEPSISRKQARRVTTSANLFGFTLKWIARFKKDVSFVLEQTDVEH